MDYFIVFLKNLKLFFKSFIFKSGDCNYFINDRPISLNLQFSKILYTFFSNILLSFCNKCNIINNEQLGFRKNISTLNSIETLQKKVIESMDLKKGVR